MTFANARGARSEGLQALRTSARVTWRWIAPGITHSDSAGLAVMLDWMATMKREGRPLQLPNLPQGLLAVASISGVEEMLQKGV